MLYDNQASYEPDMAAEIDKEWEILADEWGVSIDTALEIIRWGDRRAVARQAEGICSFFNVFRQKGVNQPLLLDCFALAAGLDSLNGVKTQTQIAEEHGVTRALVSHYVIGIRDLLSGGHGNFDVYKFRKRNETRQTYREQATDPFLEAKRKARAKIEAENDHGQGS